MTADLQSLKSESCRQKCFRESPTTEFLSVTHGLSSASEYSFISRTSEPMLWFVQHIPLLVSKSLLWRAHRIMVAISGHWGLLCCICLPALPVASYVTIASSVTELYLNHDKTQGGNGMPLLSSCEVTWHVTLKYQRFIRGKCQKHCWNQAKSYAWNHSVQSRMSLAVPQSLSQLPVTYLRSLRLPRAVIAPAFMDE